MYEYITIITITCICILAIYATYRFSKNLEHKIMQEIITGLEKSLQRSYEIERYFLDQNILPSDEVKERMQKEHEFIINMIKIAKEAK